MPERQARQMSRRQHQGTSVIIVKSHFGQIINMSAGARKYSRPHTVSKVKMRILLKFVKLNSGWPKVSDCSKNLKAPSPNSKKVRTVASNIIGIGQFLILKRPIEAIDS
jgi:hypothetical protein